MIGETAFELGKVLLKVERSKGKSATLLRDLGGCDAETIRLQKIGKYWNKKNIFDRPDGVALVTNHRFVFLSKVKTITTTTDFLSFPLELISDLETIRVMFISPAIRFQFEGRKYVFTFFSNAGEVCQAIEDALAVSSQKV